MSTPSPHSVSLWQTPSPTALRFAGLVTVSVGLYRVYRLYSPLNHPCDFSSSPSSYRSNSTMPFISNLFDKFLNFLNKDRPCILLYQKACRFSDSDEATDEKFDERLRESLTLFAEALEKCRPKNPNKHNIHLQYALALRNYFYKEGSRQYIDEAVSQSKKADACWPESEKTGIIYTKFQINIGNIHIERFMQYDHEVTDLEYALKFGANAVRSCPTASHNERALALLLRGRAGCAKIEIDKNSTLGDLDQPITDLENAIQLRIDNKHLTATCHYNLAIAHNLRHERLKKLVDLAGAIKFDDVSQAIENGAKADSMMEGLGDPDHGSCVYNLARAYVTKYEEEVANGKNYKDEGARQYIQKGHDLLARATQIGNERVKEDCQELYNKIQKFNRSNTTKVVPSSRQTISISEPVPQGYNMAFPTTEEPEQDDDKIPDSAVAVSPTYVEHLPLRL